MRPIPTDVPVTWSVRCLSVCTSVGQARALSKNGKLDRDVVRSRERLIGPREGDDVLGDDPQPPTGRVQASYPLPRRKEQAAKLMSKTLNSVEVPVANHMEFYD